MNGVHRGLSPLRNTVAALVALGAAGCATEPARLPPALGSIPAEQAEALVRRWETQWQQFPGLRAAVDLTVVRNGRVQRTAGVLLLSPTRLRYEAITPLGLPAVVVTAGPDRLLVFSLTERKAWTARPTAEAMSRWIGIPLQPETLIRLLAGQVPPPPEGVSVRVAPGPDAHVEFEQGDRRQQVWVTGEGQPARLQIENGQRVTATFDRTLNGQLVGLALEVPSQSLEVRLRYISGETTAPRPEAFEVVLPPGVPVERVD